MNSDSFPIGHEPPKRGFTAYMDHVIYSLNIRGCRGATVISLRVTESRPASEAYFGKLPVRNAA